MLFPLWGDIFQRVSRLSSPRQPVLRVPTTETQVEMRGACAVLSSPGQAASGRQWSPPKEDAQHKCAPRTPGAHAACPLCMESFPLAHVDAPALIDVI